jgi:SAM-dependent methyltransferase
MSDFDDRGFLAAFFTLHNGLPRQAPGSDATTRRLLALAGRERSERQPAGPRALDLGCGPGRSALLLAAEAGARVTAVDLHQPFLDELTADARRRGLVGSIETVNRSMADLPYPDGSFDVIWAEGSAYLIGFDNALRDWKRLLAPGGVLVLTECEWSTDTPSPQSRAFWDAQFDTDQGLRTTEQNTAAARALGYAVIAVHPLPDSDWFDEYYTPLEARLAAADVTDPAMAQAVAVTRAEIAMRREHGVDYRYTGYVLRPA